MRPVETRALVEMLPEQVLEEMVATVVPAEELRFSIQLPRHVLSYLDLPAELVEQLPEQLAAALGLVTRLKRIYRGET